jgi:hypothetical protein
MQDNYMLAIQLIMVLAENCTIVEEDDDVYAVKVNKLILDCLAKNNLQLTEEEIENLQNDFDYYNAQFC